MQEVFIVNAIRTPIGGFLGSLSGLSATALGSAALAACLAPVAIANDAVDDVIMGCVLPAGLGQGPARQAALNAGLPSSTACSTVNKLCGSGMQALILATDQIRAGSRRVMLAGGMESMSNAPYLVARARSGLRMGHAELHDHLYLDGLQDAASGRLMGEFAEHTARRAGIDRAQMDAYAIESLQRARQAMGDGLLRSEIVPLQLAERDGMRWIEDDEQPLSARIERIATLKPAFAPDGSITAANASSISDGASALLLMSGEALQEHGLQPQARIVGHATHSQDPSEFCQAPVGAIARLLRQTGWHRDEVDLFEINEAFALVTMLAMRALELDPARVNIYGGACAQGHPIGSTGARLLVTLNNALRQSGGRRGIAALCIGGGEATAVAIERV